MNSNNIAIGPLVAIPADNSNNIEFSLLTTGDTVYSNSVPITLNGVAVEGAKIGIYKQAVSDVDGEVNDTSVFLAVATTNASGFWSVNVEAFVNFDPLRRYAFFVWYESGFTLYSAPVKTVSTGGAITVNHDALEIVNSAYSDRLLFNDPAIPAGYNKIVASHKEGGALVTYDPYENKGTAYRKLFAVERVSTPDQVVSVSINQTSVQVSEGSTVQLSATVETVGSPSTALTWTSANTAIATVSSTGLVTGVASGVVGITAESVFDDTKSDSIDVTVTSEIVTLDSRAGDEAALQELYDATQAQNLPTLTSSSQLPTLTSSLPIQNRLYLIAGDVWYARSSPWVYTTSPAWVNLGPPWTNKTGWATTGMSLANPIDGVTVGAVGAGGELRVTSIDLFQNVLVGTLPNSLGNLKYCTFLNVKHNHITGQAPPGIGLMTRLETLLLGGQVENPPTGLAVDYHPGKAVKHTDTNTFDGSVLPVEWSQLGNIKIIEFSQTRVTGNLPSEWSAMTTLEKLFLNGKRIEDGYEGGLITGSLPVSWATLNNLTNFTLNDNLNFGPADLPPEWSGMSKMAHFRIRRTRHTGSIPREWETWGNTIRLIYLRNNSFNGEIPAWLFDDRSPILNTIELTYNRFTTMEPVNLANVTKTSINVCWLDFNDITAPFPNFLRGQRNLQSFSITSAGSFNNNFSGSIDPTFFQNQTTGDYFRQIRNFWVAGQNVGGELPPLFGDSWSTSSTVRLRFNNAGFTGTFPANWGDFEANGILEYQFQGNELHGAIPVSIADAKTQSSTTVTVNTSTNVINHTNTLVDGARVYFYSTGDMPGGITSGQRYYVINRTDTTYQISLTPGGSAVNITSTGSGTLSVKVRAWRTTTDVRFDANRFTYSDIIPLLNEWPSDVPIQYQSQKTFPVDDYINPTQTPTAGTTLTLDLSGIDVTGNVYQWRKDGVNISGATSHTLSIPNVQSSDNGAYTLRITNANAPQLTESISQPITVTV